MNICFMGSMEFAVPILEKLNEKYNIKLVVTQPDKPFGRKQILKPTPVKEKALELGLPVFQPENIKKDNSRILDLDLDFIIVVAYGQMIPEKILTHAKYQAINVHASLLPKYRGGSPMHTAIKNGDKVTGVTIMYMAKKMDSGDLLSQKECVIDIKDNVKTLEEKLAKAGSVLLVETLEKLKQGLIVPIPQDLDKVTFAWNIKREDEKLDFTKTAKQVYDHVRAYNPWPLTFAELDGNKIKIYETDYVDEDLSSIPGEIVKIDKQGVYIQTSSGMVIIKELQLSGKKKMDIKSFMNGVGQSIFIIGNILK